MFLRCIKMPSAEEGAEKSQHQRDVESSFMIEGVFMIDGIDACRNGLEAGPKLGMGKEFESGRDRFELQSDIRHDADNRENGHQGAEM